MSPIEISIASDGYEWWDLVPAIVGGIIGALAGGIPAWLLARRASRETAQREKAERKERQVTQLFRIHAKLGTMFNDLSSTLLQIREMLQRPVPNNHPAPTQTRISAFAGKNFRAETHFRPDELAVLLHFDEGEYLTRLDLVGRRYLAILASLDTYGQLKNELHAFLGNKENVELGPDNTITTPLSGADASLALTKMATLESLIVDLIEHIESDLKAMVDLIQQWEPTIKPHFPDRKIPGFDLTELYRHFPEYESPDPEPSV